MRNSLETLNANIASSKVIIEIDSLFGGIDLFLLLSKAQSEEQCGSCWTSTTTTCFESVWSIAIGNLLTLSEQQLVNCITVDSACNGELTNNGFVVAVKNAMCTEANHSYSCLATEGTCKVSCCNVEVAQGSVTGYRGVSNDSEQSLMPAMAQQHDRLGGDSLQDCMVFSRVTRVACAGYVSDDRAKANSLTALADGGSGSKSDQAILVGGGWADMSAANAELENDGSVVLLDNSSFCGGNSSVATDGIDGENTGTQRE